MYPSSPHSIHPPHIGSAILGESVIMFDGCLMQTYDFTMKARLKFLTQESCKGRLTFHRILSSSIKLLETSFLILSVKAFTVSSLMLFGFL